MNSVVKLEHKDINSIAFQEASLDVGQGARDTLVGVVHRRVDRRAVLRGEAVFLVPDVERCLLEGNRIDVLVLKLDHGIHCSDGSLLTARTRRFQRNRTVGAASASAPRTTRYSWWKQ